MLDTLGHAHRRPCTLAPVISAHGGLQGGEGGVGVQQRGAAEDDLFITLFATDVDRAAHRGQWPLPLAQGTIDQVFTLFDGLAQAIRFWNLCKRWVKPGKNVFHSTSLGLL
ncbi:hypothetical protein D9M71_129100 [compost metagenome]